jgi:hypothetical protein
MRMLLGYDASTTVGLQSGLISSGTSYASALIGAQLSKSAWISEVRTSSTTVNDHLIHAVSPVVWWLDQPGSLSYVIKAH